MTASTPAWKRHSGFVARPTVALAAGVLLAYAGTVAAAATGALPTAAALPLLVVLQYVAFTPLHEAVHGNVSGDRGGQGWLDRAVGWPMAALLLAPYPAFVAIHLAHHARTNDPDEDPDFHVAGPWWLAPLRCLTILPAYEVRFFWRPSKLMLAQRRAGLVGCAILYGAAGALVAAGYGATLALLWLLPGTLAAGLLAFAFDWLPHHPHRARGRYIDTRVLLAPGLRWLMLGQDLHAVHHLWPRVPFYRYGAVWAEEAEGMIARGTPVTRWLAPPLPHEAPRPG